MGKENIFNYDKPEDSSGYLLWHVSNLRQKLANNILSEVDLTYVQFILLTGLQWLKIEQGKVNQVSLINFTKIDKSVVSSILKILIEKKFVSRFDDQIDTRAKLLELTKLGIERLQKAHKLIADFDISFFGFKQSEYSQFNLQLLDILKRKKS